MTSILVSNWSILRSPEQHGLVGAAVEEVDGALNYGDRPLGDVVGDVGEVGRQEGQDAIKSLRGSELPDQSHAGRKIGHFIFQTDVFSRKSSCFNF